ncbi:MAG: TlyA family RNA methyltransferase [Spirochaetes bacterium]|nr:TlyA family RNA methyltransferase [Spirochaetota bacterium]
MKKEKLINRVLQILPVSEKEAIAIILSGLVLVNEEVVTKKGILVAPSDQIRIKAKKKFVSRAAEKLKYALEKFELTINNWNCLDIGSSTGGFTQILLLNGAKQVIAVDSGTNQLDYSLRIDPRVMVIENKKIQDLKMTEFPDTFQLNLAVMDVSFTSSVPILKYIRENLKIPLLIVLIKPQFEYQRLKKQWKFPDSFNGVIEDEQLLAKIIRILQEEILRIPFQINGILESPVKGQKGNTEYLFFLK